MPIKNPTQTLTAFILGKWGGRLSSCYSIRLGIERSRVRSPGGAKKWMHVCKYLPLLSCVLYYIVCLIVVSVCTIVKLRHWVSLVPLFGSVYITVVNCVCYVLFIWCTVLRGRYCVIQHSCCNTNKTIIIIFWPRYSVPRVDKKLSMQKNKLLLLLLRLERRGTDCQCMHTFMRSGTLCCSATFAGGPSDVGFSQGAYDSYVPSQWPAALPRDECQTIGSLPVCAEQPGWLLLLLLLLCERRLI